MCRRTDLHLTRVFLCLFLVDVDPLSTVQTEHSCTSWGRYWTRPRPGSVSGC